MKSDTENRTAHYVHEVTGKLKTFVVGVGIGALIGLLFAPASGKKTRKYITRAAKQGLDDAASTGKRWSRLAQDTVDHAKAGVAEAGQEAYRTARDA